MRKKKKEETDSRLNSETQSLLTLTSGISREARLPPSTFRRFRRSIPDCFYTTRKEEERMRRRRRRKKPSVLAAALVSFKIETKSVAPLPRAGRASYSSFLLRGSQDRRRSHRNRSCGTTGNPPQSRRPTIGSTFAVSFF